MIRPTHVIAGLLLAVFVFATPTAQGHSAFKKYMSTKFPDKKLNCNVCHVKGQKKDVKNAYGQLFIKVMKKPDLTKNWKALKGAEKKAFEKEQMLPAFEKAYKKISKMTFADLIKYNMVEGVKGPMPEPAGDDKPAEPDTDAASGAKTEENAAKPADDGDSK